MIWLRNSLNINPIENFWELIYKEVLNAKIKMSLKTLNEKNKKSSPMHAANKNLASQCVY